MRSLALASSKSWRFPSKKIAKIAVEVDEDRVFVLSESQNADADVQLELYTVKRHDEEKVLPSPVAVFTVSGFLSRERSQVVSLRYLSDTQNLCLITYDGDIGLVALDEDASMHTQLEIVGSIDAGITAACWSPDDSLLSVVTGDNKLLLMTNTFDVITETLLYGSDRGEDQPVSVGWGSKQTQFHGSLGKAAAQAPQSALDSIGASPDDDGSPRISWRDDCAYFVVSSLDKVESGSSSRRVLRIFDRQGGLQNTSEPIAGLEHTLCWRPCGNLIASSQRFGFEGGGAGKDGRHDIVFFERNGLRHGEFTLRESSKKEANEVVPSENTWRYKVKELVWNSDSTILAVWMDSDEGDVVQLWSMNNYHWYLKQEVLAFTESKSDCRFTSVQWHPEDSYVLLLTTETCLVERSFAWETFISRSKPPDDTGTVAVIDGVDILLTPFRIQNVPPPMCSFKLALSNPSTVRSLPHDLRTPIHLCFSNQNDVLGVLRHGGRIQLWRLSTRQPTEPSTSHGPAFEPCMLCDTSLDVTDNVIEPRQIGVWRHTPTFSENTAIVGQSFRIACLSAHADSDLVSVVDVTGTEVTAATRIVIPGRDGKLLHSDEGIFWQSRSGQIHSISADDDIVSPLTEFPEFCSASERLALLGSESIFVGRAESGKLYVTSSNSTRCQTLATNCTSFIVAAGFVIYTTSSHEAFFAPIDALEKLLTAAAEIPYDGEGTGTAPDDMIVPQWERRRVERGSRIVTAVPSSMSLVLQMPRGNLETINPRPLVMAVVREDVNFGNFRKAFMACRKHRIDFSVLVEHDPDTFRKRIPEFVEQVNDVDFLNLFLTNIGHSNLSATDVTVICDSIRLELTSRSLTQYVNTILTAFVVKRPPNYEAALSLLHELKESNQEMVEDAVKYIIFLVDVDKLFDTALGMYDFTLVLLIAQQSQRDPREYLPFLRELRALPKFYQRYKIDDHLKRVSSALKNLSLAGQDYFDEAVAYTEKHRLYTEALKIWSDDERRYSRILEVYGDYLYECHDYKQAAIVFVEAKRREKAMVAYERALLWRELFELASQSDVDDSNGDSEPERDLVQLAFRVADELSSKKRHAEAAQVLLDYGQDVRNSITALGHGNHFSEARRIIALHRAPELVEEILHPAALDSRAQIGEDIEEMRTQLQKQVQRLRDLAERKIAEPDAFYGTEDDPNLHNVDAMTDMSMPATAFTRYTVAPSNMSKSTSKRTSRSKRKMERKVGSGRKGTVDEEEYLLKSLTKLVARFEGVQSEVSSLLPHLTFFSKEHREEARALQSEMSLFTDELWQALSEIWAAPKQPDNEDPTDEYRPDSWAARMADTVRRNEKRDPRERVPKPELTLGSLPQGGRSNALPDWKVGLLHI